MLIAGAALSLMQTAAAALGSASAGSGAAQADKPQADKPQTGPSAFDQAADAAKSAPAKRARPLQQLSDQVQATLQQVQDTAKPAMADIGHALRAYTAKRV